MLLPELNVPSPLSYNIFALLGDATPVLLSVIVSVGNDDGTAAVTAPIAGILPTPNGVVSPADGAASKIAVAEWFVVDLNWISP